MTVKGIKTVLIPKENIRDLEEVKKEVLEKLEIIPVAHINEALSVAFRDWAKHMKTKQKESE